MTKTIRYGEKYVYACLCAWVYVWWHTRRKWWYEILCRMQKSMEWLNAFSLIKYLSQACGTHQNNACVCVYVLWCELEMTGKWMTVTRALSQQCMFMWCNRIHTQEFLNVEWNLDKKNSFSFFYLPYLFSLSLSLYFFSWDVRIYASQFINQWMANYSLGT